MARLIFRPLWWLDGRGHAHLSRRLHRLLLGRVCDWCDNELTRPGKRPW